jgi:NCS1 family nucleobase:cation symporter-1
MLLGDAAPGPNAPDAYGDRIAAVEPFGLERIAERERHGSPRDLFALWFAANAETATFAVGILTVALYGTSFRGAVLGIVIGNLLSYGVVGALACGGPRLGRPQMIISRRTFGGDANAIPAVLAFLAGVGWFGINSIFGAAALAIVAHLGYLPAVAIVVIAQIAIAIYGHNMIHVFERFAGIVLTFGFVALAAATIPRVHLGAGFNPHAPVAAGGEVAGIVYSAALAFSYAIGWGPCAADYSRYLPARSSARAVWTWTFLGGAVPSTALELLGAATVTALPGARLADATPADLIFAIFGHGAIALVGLITVTAGTLSANCLNVYSGSISALTAWDDRGRAPFALLIAGLFGALTAGVLQLARQSDPANALAAGPVVAFAGAIAVLGWLVVRYTLSRPQAALAVGIVGAAIALAGTQPGHVAHDFANFLLLLSSWAAPWAGAMLATAGADHSAEPIAPGFFGWLIGIAASIPFWQQSWFVGPVAATHPELGDVSYFVGFGAAYLACRVFSRAVKAPYREPAAR